MGLLRGSSMDRSEPALVPEWLRQNHHSSFQSGLTRSSSFSNRSHPPFAFGDRVSERESSSNNNSHRSYQNFGRGRFERSERDREVPVISRGHDWEWARERGRVYDGGERPQGSFGDGGRYKGPHGSPRLPPARLEVPGGLVAEKKFPGWPINGAYERKPGPRSSPATPSSGRTSSLVSWGGEGGGESESVESHSPSPSPSPSPSAPPKMSEALINSTQSQAASENQRLEEIALKQSRQLIPMKPALPKTMGASNNKLKQQVKIVTTLESKSSSPLASAAAPYRPPPVTPKQLLVLKSKNSASGCLSTTTGSSTSPPANSNGSATPKQGMGLKPRDGGAEERKPLVLSQNRSDFFNAIRKKAAANGENRNPQENESEMRRAGEGDETTSQSSRKVAAVVSEVKPAAGGGGGESNGHHQHPELKPEFVAAAAPVLCGSEEEEMNFLKSLGWVESPGEGEDEALTTEEINSFFQKHPSALNQMLRNLSGSSLGSPSSMSGSDSDDESRVQSA